MSKIKFIQSPNCYQNRGNHSIEYIVIHAMVGFMQPTINRFEDVKTQVSANYLIDRAGNVVQMVHDEQAAWHVAEANRFCIGIEHEDMWKDPLGRPVGGCQNNIPWWTQAQLEASAQIVAQLLIKYNLPLSHVIGHNDPYLIRFKNNHSDPGHLFPWPGYRQLVQEYLDEIKIQPTVKALQASAEKSLVDSARKVLAPETGLSSGHTEPVPTGDKLSPTESPVVTEADFQPDTQQLFKPKNKKNKQRYGLS